MRGEAGDGLERSSLVFRARGFTIVALDDARPPATRDMLEVDRYPLGMKPSELLGPTDLVLGFDPSDKWTCIQDLVQHLVDSGRLDPGLGETVAEAVLSRERSMSTGMEEGVAIPHAALEDVSEVIACLGIIQTEEGLDFESIDGRPTRLVVLLVIPKSQKLLHIRTLADIARVLSKGLVRDELLAAQDQPRAHSVLVAGES